MVLVETALLVLFIMTIVSLIKLDQIERSTSDMNTFIKTYLTTDMELRLIEQESKQTSLDQGPTPGNPEIPDSENLESRIGSPH